MRKIRTYVFAGILASGAAALWSAVSGCSDTWLNLTKVIGDDVTMVFINNTPYRAAFSYGSYDAWNRNPPGDVDFAQTSVEAHSDTAGVSVTCGRNVAIGTQGLVTRVLDTSADVDYSGFDANRFDTTVHFSDAPAGSDAQYLATAGTAAGLEVLLGVDYSCGDTLMFIFEEDPQVDGGFRIDFQIIRDENTDD